MIVAAWSNPVGPLSVDSRQQGYGGERRRPIYLTREEMDRKFFEIRDAATCIPAMGFSIDGNDSWLAWKAGFGPGHRMIILVKLNEPSCQYDPFKWNMGRTMTVAHRHIEEHWDTLKDGDLIDVEFIIGLTNEPKKSERSSHEECLVNIFTDGGE